MNALRRIAVGLAEPDPDAVQDLVILSGAPEEVVSQIVAEQHEWLSRLDQITLTRRYELTEKQAAKFLAAIRLAVRFKGQPPIRQDAPKFTDPGPMARWIWNRHIPKDHEEAGLVLLDGRHRPITSRIFAVGAPSAAIIHPSLVVRYALDARATAVIFFHNHPSGDPFPSNEDFEITGRLKKALAIVGINLLDSIIIAESPSNYYSFASVGWANTF